MRMTSKGQVTIPKHIREKLGVGPGDDIGFREEGQAVILENESEKGVGSDFADRIRKVQRLVAEMERDGRKAPLGMSVDEYMDKLRGYSDDANDPGFQHRS
jgi:AbrB family looped-hinge helix DNA binding protein